jgi:Ca-activated chloride channel family protein
MSSDIGKSTTRQAQVNVELRPLKSALSTAGGEMPVMLRITPERLAESGERPRINLALVLDRSGSMSGTPLEQAKAGARAAIELLAADDRVSVVTYDDEVDVIVPNTSAADKPRILGAVANVHSGGTTALHAGWLEGAAQASQGLDPAGLNRVVLLTDGLANRGETDLDTICSDVAGVKAHGVTTSTLGLGRQFNEDLLEGMAHGGGGNYYLAESAEQLRSIFAAELHGLSATVGRQVRMTFRPKVTYAEVSEVLNDLPEEEGALILPDLIAGLPLEIGAVLRTPALPEGEAELGSAKLTWQNPDGESFELSLPLRLEVVSPDSFSDLPEDPEVASLIAELRAARMKREATAALDRGDRAAASAILSRARKDLDSAPQTDRIRYELDELGLLDLAMSQMDDVLARKRMKAQAYRKSRSFYHERLDGAPKQAATSGSDVTTFPRSDGTTGVLELTLGDITAERVDAILNPTNTGLFGTGRSVDGAVHREGGIELTRACRHIGRVEIGKAVVTPGFKLPAQYVIHTAVPTWRGSPKDATLLAACYRSSLDLAARMNLASIAVPAMGTGTNGFPMPVSAEVALTELLRQLRGSGAPELIRVVLFDQQALEVYRAALGTLGKAA